MQNLNLPTFLTLVRMIGAPVLVPFFIINTLSFQTHSFSLAILCLFFGITDFLDGYFARLYQIETKLGKVLDPLADKFFMYSALLALLAVHKIYYVWALILIGREFFVMGIRQLGYEYKITAVAVSWWGKLKTVVHICFVAWVVANPMQGQGYASWWNIVESALLAASLISSVGSAVHYYMIFYAML